MWTRFDLTGLKHYYISYWLGNHRVPVHTAPYLAPAVGWSVQAVPHHRKPQLAAWCHHKPGQAGQAGTGAPGSGVQPVGPPLQCPHTTGLLGTLVVRQLQLLV